jgi:hypothetical protein
VHLPTTAAATGETGKVDIAIARASSAATTDDGQGDGRNS